MKFLVLGGAGYVGSHFVAHARDQKHQSICVDNLSHGHECLTKLADKFYKIDISQTQELIKIIQSEKPDTILHYAGLILVGESVHQPAKYYANNITGTQSVLDAMVATKNVCKNFIFSSTCAVFGNPDEIPIHERQQRHPTSPYGNTKLACELMVEDYTRAYGLKALIFRYFNASGADQKSRTGEMHEPESHLIPNILKAAQGQQELTIFGDDFDTQDGTCVRDYIHVTDLAESHLMGANYLLQQNDGFYDYMHLGTGKGLSNLEIVKACENVVGKKIAYKIGPRRSGDPAVLVCDPSYVKEKLNFVTKHSDIQTITSSAWKFMVSLSEKTSIRS